MAARAAKAKINALLWGACISLNIADLSTNRPQFSANVHLFW
jgi:hypothetical protein